jgi:hypothetical protein
MHKWYSSLDEQYVARVILVPLQEDGEIGLDQKLAGENSLSG